MEMQKIPKEGERSEEDEGAMKMQGIPKEGERSKEDEGAMKMQGIPKEGERSKEDEGAMKMQGIPKKEERSKEDEGASEPMLKVKTKEEAEQDHYSNLQSPTDDIYSEAVYCDPPDKAKPGKQTEGNPRPYRAACLFLSLICLVLLVVVIFLSMKLQTGSTMCPEPERGESTPADKGGAPLAPSCSHEECLDILPTYLGCGRCPGGWLPFGQSCFYLSTYRLNWDRSQSNCTARGGALAVVTSLKVQNFLIEKGKMTYWIGLRRKGDTWTWVDDTVLGKSYWADVPERDCGILSTKNPPEKNWLTSSCSSVSYFICQMAL